MGTTKCIDIKVCENKLTMTLLGNQDVKREDFLDEMVFYLFCNWFGNRMHPILVMIREIVKNVFDHGTGKGELTLIKKGDNYEFEFIDHNPQKINFAEICKINKDNGWIRKTSSNCNVGLSIIQNHGENLKNFSIDDSNGGINYSGEYGGK